jgi:glycosyltransferase involved in cell wall biosynthesis
MEKLKVFIVSSGWVPLPPEKGGAVENYVCNVVKYCRKLGVNAIAVDSQINRNKKGIEMDLVTFEDENVPVLRLPVSVPKIVRRVPKLKNREWIFEEFFFGKNIAKRLSKFIDYDLIHINNAWVGFAFALFNDTKFVYTCHNPLWPENSVHLGEKIIRFVEGYAMKKSARVIALNKTMLNAIKEKAKLDQRKIEIIPNGVDIDFFKPDIESDAVLKKFGLEKNRYILFVGRVSFIKGVHNLVEAFKLLINKNNNNIKKFKLAIVGPLSDTFGERTQSQYAKWLIDYATEKLNGQVVFTGAISRGELRILYSNAYCFVLPSISEAFPMVIIEAMASGLPVIGSNAGGIPDIIENDVGYIFEKTSYEDLARKIEEVISNEKLRNELARNARKKAVEKYSWLEIASKLKKLYINVLKG